MAKWFLSVWGKNWIDNNELHVHTPVHVYSAGTVTRGLRPIASFLGGGQPPTSCLPSLLASRWNIPLPLSLLSHVKELCSNYLCCSDVHSPSVAPPRSPYSPGWICFKHSFPCSFQFGPRENTCQKPLFSSLSLFTITPILSVWLSA